MARRGVGAHELLLQRRCPGDVAADAGRAAGASTIALSLAVLAGVAQLLRIREFGEARDLVLGRLRRMTALKRRGWLGLHPSIWETASTHFVVDAYGNMYAPLLPLLIPQLGLSLKTAGIAGDVLSDGELGLAARRSARWPIAGGRACW